MGAGASAFEPELSSLSCDELHGTLWGALCARLGVRHALEAHPARP